MTPSIDLLRLDLVGEISYDHPLLELLGSLPADGEGKHFAGLILWVNSGGGSLCAAQEIASGIRALSLPTVAVIADLCASAAYYAIAPSTRILSRPASLVGGLCSSLDYRRHPEPVEGQPAGMQAVTHGALKHMLTPYGPSGGPLEQRAIDDLLQDLDLQFHSFIESHRGDRNRWDLYTDGRLITGRRAIDAGLVDGLGGVREAVEEIATLLDIPHEEITLVHATPDLPGEEAERQRAMADQRLQPPS